MSKLVVAGKLNSRQFQKAKKAAEYVAAGGVIDLDILALLPTDYEELVVSVAKQLGGAALAHKGNVMAYTAAGEYIGDVNELLSWLGALCGYDNGKTNEMLYERMAKAHLKKYMASTKSEFVYLDFEIDGAVEGRVFIELFAGIAPETCSNFAKLVEGVDMGEAEGVRGYKGTPIHRVVKGGWIQGGDIVDGSGRSSESAFGAPLPDETYAVQHDKAGIIGLANTGPHTNGSQFYITLRPLPWLDTRRVAFGRVVDGMRTLKIIERLECENERPEGSVKIAGAGKWEVGSLPPPPVPVGLPLPPLPNKK